MGRHWRRRTRLASGALVLAGVLVARPASAWIYPEHRRILIEAMRKLSPSDRQLLSELWASARTGRESRLCGEIEDEPKPGTALTCIDLGAWPAIAGDHSCSPEQFLDKTLTSDWIVKVADIGAQIQVRLDAAKNREDKLNDWAWSNLALQSVDPEYASRAGANNGHFLLTRSSDDPSEYLLRTLGPDAEPNALGLYLYYHLAAVDLAHRWPSAEVAARPALAARILATEAFGLHFLEDMFAAGHVAGSWGSVAERKGTHDYYSEFGLDTMSWKREPIIVLGDAHMRPADLAQSSAAIAQSVSQVLAALGEKTADTPAQIAAADAATRYDSCTATKQASDTVDKTRIEPALGILAQTPMPGRAESDVHVPHFRQEIGPFVGFSGDLNGGGAFGGFQSPDLAPRPFGSAEVAFRVGVGLEALTGSTGAGQAFLSFGYHYQTSQPDSADTEFSKAGFPRVPARRGLALRLRVPFYIIPFDLIPAALVLVWASPETLTNMGIVAASGGLLPWHRAFNTPVGAFQFLLGREVGWILFGYVGDRMESVAVVPAGATTPTGGNLAFVNYRSLMLDFPSFEYRPLRNFSTNQALTFGVIFGWGVEFPNQVRYSSRLQLPAATGPTPDLGTSWNIYLRLHFDARYYF